VLSILDGVLSYLSDFFSSISAKNKKKETKEMKERKGDFSK